MGGLTVAAIESSLTAFHSNDTRLANEVIAGDDAIDALNRQIHTACLEIIWRHQPVAGDLRVVSGMLEIASDLERAADYAVSIAKNAITLSELQGRPRTVDFGRAGNSATGLLRDAVKAYMDLDEASATSVIARDVEVDAIYRSGLDSIEEEMEQDAQLVRAGAVCLFVLARIERVGDRALNIAWHTKETLGAA